MNIDLRLGDCLEVLKTLEDNSVDSVVTDPPYGLSFMNKKWDYDVPSVEVWKECLRVLKPGGHLLAFAGSRTYHRMAIRIEDAGFEIRDQIMWIYGSGFPKSHNIGKAIDKIQGENDWEGWGSALKPAHEPIVMARKPLSEKSIAENVLKYGTGGINIDDCRIETDDNLGRLFKETDQSLGIGQFGVNDGRKTKPTNKLEGIQDSSKGLGRFPANIIFDEEAGKILDEQSGERGNGWKKNYGKEDYEGLQYSSSTQQCVFGGGYNGKNTYADKGGASRFFYCPKVSKKERNMNMNNLIIWEDKLTTEQETLNELLKDIFVDTINIQDEQEWNIISFGNNITEQYQTDIRFITSIILKMITGLKTLSYYPHLSTKDYIVDAIKTIMENGLNLVDYAENINQLKQNTTNEVWGYRLGVVSVVLPTLLSISKKGRTGNFHATVKPIALMEYLITLVTPPNGTVLEPFMGSGSTGIAAKNLGFSFIGIEKEDEYMEIAKQRIGV